MADISPILAGLRGRCGTCGQGRLFVKYLKLAPSCGHCGQDFSVADTADGPAFFVGFGVLILLAPFYFVLPMFDISLVAKVIGYGAIVAATFGLCLWLLPMAKAVLFNLQLRHRAEEARFED